MTPWRTSRFTSLWTVTITDPQINWTAWNVVTIRATTAGTKVNFAKAWGWTVQCDYVTFIDINATPSNIWYATNSTITTTTWVTAGSAPASSWWWFFF